MNLATRVLTAGLIAVLCFSTGKGVVANPLTEIELVTTMTATGQQQGSLYDQQKQEEVLRNARAAMRAGDYQRAGSLIEQAKSFNAPGDPAFSKFRDTPEKAAQDLADLQGAKSNPDYVGQKLLGQSPDMQQQMAAEALARGKAALESGQTMSALNYYQQAAKAGPNFQSAGYSVMAFRRDLEQAGVQGAMLGGDVAAAPQATTPTRLPSVSETPEPSTTANPYMAASGAQGNAETARRMLLQARLELARGNVALSEKLVRQVNGLGLVYPAHQDSPENVDYLIRKVNQVSASPVGPQSAYQFGEVLLQQAEGLMLYGQYDLAEQMTRQVQSMNLDFQRARVTPDRLMTEITRRRSGQSGGQQASPQVPDNIAGNARAKEQAILVQAKAALDRGDIGTAEAFTKQASTLGNGSYQQGDLRPDLLMLEIQRAKASSPVRHASGTQSQGGAGFPVAQGLYNPQNDDTRNMPASAQQGATGQAGMRYLQEGEQALAAGDKMKARKLFEEAWKYENQLEPGARQRLQDFLQYQTNPVTSGVAQTSNPSPLAEIDARQQVLLRQMIAEVTRGQSQADAMREVDPKGALDKLKTVRKTVDESAIDAVGKKQLLSRVDRSIESLETYIDMNKSQIELDERNAALKKEIKDERDYKLEVDNKLAEMVEQFNELMDQQRWQEAEVLARQAREMDPENPVVQTLIWKSKFARRTYQNLALQDQKEEAVWATLQDVENSAIPFNDSNPIRFGDAKEWADMTERRRRWLAENSQISEDEVEIRKALKTKVDVKFNKQSLQSVMETLGSMVGINVMLDPRGLQAEGVTYDTEITINMQQAVRLDSALNHILQPLRLSYVIRDEALVITSESFRSRNVYQKVYNVADLVLPIPNFVPSYNMGLPGAIKAAYESQGLAGSPAGTMGGTNPMSLFAQGEDLSSSSALAQVPNGFIPGLSGGGPPVSGQAQGNMGFGPGGGVGGAGGFGGGVQPDFDSLIELITTTVEPESWEELGGPGSVAPFATNLSLVVSQTQEVHDRLADLLAQLRRLQDLQVTIEVRFITLTDNFFERIGVDFDFELNDNSDGPSPTGSPSVTVGLNEYDPVNGPVFTEDLDLQFTQQMFANTVPAVGGLIQPAGAQFGFAMLSDIEAYFVMQAAQGDLRSNVMQAPKVTLFNGQTAFVSDTTQTPFVTSVVPVVGDFAAAQQPVIVVLNEGTSLSVQAVVSPDRRFVRLTLVPFFSRIGNVEEFTFEGTTSSRTDSTVTDPDAPDGGSTEDEEEETTSGTTIQLPQFSFVTVSTTVSVPDGGTVLLGGIKRLSEERRERGIPVFSKLPYINRLFRNVGIGRETQSLMMMVTPRIIIQEEEEAKLGFTN
ncbi:type II secretion system protein GspD [Bremerella sp. T1]|uniref:general secretion pathway protein GspD n=1 Tax=Bremerella sp. TYQ1 TaxID=3119568 RepID=UPI001CCA7A0C|nr:general secretion pathway protein GspD [Bremerella volcania]UBM35828.1 general secretion pathway protein GspD [Bremerella volcania]